MAAIQAYAPGTQYAYPPRQNPPIEQNRWNGSGPRVADRELPSQRGPSDRQMAVTAEYYSSERMYLEYTNNDGDSVRLDWQRVEYQKAQISVENQGSGESTDEQWRKIVDDIQEKFRSLKDWVLRDFIRSLTDGEGNGSAAVNDTAKAAPAQTSAVVPEEWNAENTSQRIVDFAVSFYDAFSGAGEDFLKQIRDAIDAGFKQARESLGELPDAVNRLIDETYALVTQKLDSWAEQKDIGADSAKPVTENADAGSQFQSYTREA